MGVLALCAARCFVEADLRLFPSILLLAVFGLPGVAPMFSLQASAAVLQGFGGVRFRTRLAMCVAGLCLLLGYVDPTGDALVHAPVLARTFLG
jgi:hypothetical protein